MADALRATGWLDQTMQRTETGRWRLVLALLAALILPPLLLMVPGVRLSTLIGDRAFVTDFVVGSVSALAVVALVWRVERGGLRAAFWLVLVSLLPTVATAGYLIATAPRTMWWGMSTWWVVAVVGGILLSWAGPWPQERALLVLGWTVASASFLSPLIMAGPALGALMPLNGLLVATAIAVGLLVRKQRLHVEEQRAAVRDRERRAMADEMHDVIAHEITGIIVLAQGLGASGGQTGALDQIEASGRRALDHIRALVATTRAGAPAPVLPSPPSVSAIADLVSTFAQTSTARVNLVNQAPDSVPAAVANAAHRLVSEALTNVRRHALTATVVDVEITPSGDGLEIVIGDNGHGGGLGSGGGSGLAAVSERIALLGGHIEFGPTSQGWQVKAWIPIEGASR